MAQKYYEVTVEAMVQRTVTVEAENIVDAEIEARREVRLAVGALSTEVMQAYRTDASGNRIINLTLNGE
jgi:hypothetical protein